MLSKALECLRRQLTKPLFRTRFIPDDASVDPTLLPEDEFPVHCVKCRYALRGLDDGRCPECGTPFERGRLLVRQYVHDWRGAKWRQSSAARWSCRFALIGLALPILSGVGMACVMCYLCPNDRATRPTTAQVDFGVCIAYCLIGAAFVGLALQAISIVITTYTSPRNARRQRRFVIDAMRGQGCCHSIRK